MSPDTDFVPEGPCSVVHKKSMLQYQVALATEPLSLSPYSVEVAQLSTGLVCTDYQSQPIAYFDYELINSRQRKLLQRAEEEASALQTEIDSEKKRLRQIGFLRLVSLRIGQRLLLQTSHSQRGVDSFESDQVILPSSIGSAQTELTPTLALQFTEPATPCARSASLDLPAVVLLDRNVKVSMKVSTIDEFNTSDYEDEMVNTKLKFSDSSLEKSDSDQYYCTPENKSQALLVTCSLFTTTPSLSLFSVYPPHVCNPYFALSEQRISNKYCQESGGQDNYLGHGSKAVVIKVCCATSKTEHDSC
uniref:Uncharacterized protein n=1 Tax=Timema shepardi TaxID=629360 RepID=A0A7R9G0N2_TIMSH|nr:unnamed protein product [Timema shepardi]